MIYGDGNCAIPGCKTKTKIDQLMCRHHWFLVTPQLRLNVSEALRHYRRNEITLGDLRVEQDKAVNQVKPGSVQRGEIDGVQTTIRRFTPDE